jgi:hypothetical protein
MKKVLISAVLVLSSLVALPVAAGFSCASQIDGISGLSDQDKQIMIVKCEQTKLNVVATPKIGNTTVDEMDKWSDVSLKFAKAIGVAAKEFGVAVNDFLGTDVGKLTAVFIGWQVLGEDITYAALVILILIFTLGTTNKLRKAMRLEGYEEQDKTFMGKVIGKTKQPTYNSWKQTTGDTATLIVLTHLFEILVFIVILANF